MRTIISLLLFTLTSNCFAQLSADSLVAYYPMNGNTSDHGPNSNNGVAYNFLAYSTDRFGNPHSACQFNGVNQFIEVSDQDYLSVSKTGKLSISVWMRPDTLDFVKSEGEYVHWMGKGVSGQHEIVFRMYNLVSSRPNRISAYVFNLTGGLGSGSYVQETTTKGEWIHIVATYNYLTNTIHIYKNGVLKDTDFFSDYSVVPGNGTAPFRIGTRDFASYFRGAIDDLRIFSGELKPNEVTELYKESNSIVTTLDSENGKYNPFEFEIKEKGVLSISNSSTLGCNYSIEIVSSVGQNIYSQKNISQSLEIPMQSGMYIINLIDLSRNEHYQQKVFIP